MVSNVFLRRRLSVCALVQTVLIVWLTNVALAQNGGASDASDKVAKVKEEIIAICVEKIKGHTGIREPVDETKKRVKEKIAALGDLGLKAANEIVLDPTQFPTARDIVLWQLHEMGKLDASLAKPLADQVRDGNLSEFERYKAAYLLLTSPLRDLAKDEISKIIEEYSKQGPEKVRSVVLAYGKGKDAQEGDDEKKPLEIRIEKDGVEFIARIEEGNLPPAGGPITLTVEFVNHTKDKVDIPLARKTREGCCELILLDDWGKPVPKTRYGRRLDGLITGFAGDSVGPGEAWKYVFLLSRYFDLSVAAPYELQVRTTYLSAGFRFEAGPLKFVVYDPASTPIVGAGSGWPDAVKKMRREEEEERKLREAEQQRQKNKEKPPPEEKNNLQEQEKATPKAKE